MNIFYLDKSAHLAAAAHCDKHVGKMLIESCQMMATAHHSHGNGDRVKYRSTHVNHPCTIWVRSAAIHYAYVRDLAVALGEQFHMRYGKIHASAIVLNHELMLPPPAMRTDGEWQDPPQAMPDEFKNSDPVIAYRAYYSSKAATMQLIYYRGEKPQPVWLRNSMSDFGIVATQGQGDAAYNLITQETKILLAAPSD